MRSLLLSVVVLLSLKLSAHAFDEHGLADNLSGGTGPVSQLDLARNHFEEGLRLYNEGKWSLARFEFEASYALSKAPDLLHNLSYVAEKQGRLAEAVVLEERFIVELGAKLKGADRELALSRLFRLREAMKTPAPPIPVPEEPGVAGSQPPSTKPSPPKKAPTAKGPFVLIGVGFGALAVGIGTGVAASSIRSTIEEGGTYSPGDYNSLYSRGQTLHGVSISFGTIGAVMLGSGIIWAVVDRVRRRPPT